MIRKFSKRSFSQSGEDMIVDFIRVALGLQQFTYLDVGAHHPFYLSNTAFFYKAGFRGVCVEPDPTLFKLIRKKRKRDLCLNTGVGVENSNIAEFYILDSSTLNTFSRDEAERYVQEGHEIISVVNIPLIEINSIIKESFELCPNFLSLDIEGMDLDILKAIDFTRFRPEIVCVETVTYSRNNKESKIEEIPELMKSKGYMAYSDTYINTIFVEKACWENRP